MRKEDIEKELKKLIMELTFMGDDDFELKVKTYDKIYGLIKVGIAYGYDFTDYITDKRINDWSECHTVNSKYVLSNLNRIQPINHVDGIAILMEPEEGLVFLVRNNSTSNDRLIKFEYSGIIRRYLIEKYGTFYMNYYTYIDANIIEFIIEECIKEEFECADDDKLSICIYDNINNGNVSYASKYSEFRQSILDDSRITIGFYL